MTDLKLPRGVQKVLKAEDKDYDRGLLVKLLENGGYTMAYWYEKPDKPAPVEVLVDGKSIKKDAKVVEMKFHPKEYHEKNENTNSKYKLAEDLRKWVQQRWVDIGAPKKGGGFKPCGRSKGEKRKGYPKCVPAAKAASMSKGQRRSAVKRKRAAGNPGGKPTMVSTFKNKKSSKKESVELFGQIISEKLCARGKAAAKRKFDVYPSAYANMYASAVCSGKTTPGGKKKKKKGKKK